MGYLKDQYRAGKEQGLKQSQEKKDNAKKLEKIKEQLKKANVTDTFGTKKEIKALPEILSDDEEIKYATSGFLEENTVLVVCTDERIVFIDKGFIYGIKSTEIPLDMVNGVSYSKGMVFGSIAIVNGAINTRIEKVNKETAPIMVDAIKKAAAQHKQQIYNFEADKQNVNASEDIVEQLRKLKPLIDEGIITEEEFAAKKKQILNI